MTYHAVGQAAHFTGRIVCISAAEKFAAEEACRAKTVIKGVGQVDPCLTAQMPVCPDGYGPGEGEGEGAGGGEVKDGTKKAMMVGGILLLVVVGGYVVYRTTKKGKLRRNARRRRGRAQTDPWWREYERGYSAARRRGLSPESAASAGYRQARSEVGEQPIPAWLSRRGVKRNVGRTRARSH